MRYRNNTRLFGQKVTQEFRQFLLAQGHDGRIRCQPFSLRLCLTCRLGIEIDHGGFFIGKQAA